jgi:hypothetical protein
MACLDDLCVSITELSTGQAASRIMERRFRRRKAWTALTVKKSCKKAKTTKAKTKTKTRKAKKPASLKALVSAMTPEQKQKLIASFGGASK